MKNIRWAIGCFLLIILSIYICYIVALNNYTVDIAFFLTKCGILEKFEFTKENLVTNDDSDTKDAQENLDNTNITTTDNKAQRRTPGLSASKDLRKNMFEIEKDFFASKKIFLQNKGINIEYPYMQKFNSIIELLIKHGYDIDDIHDSFGGFCYNIDKIKDTDLYKFQLLSTLLKLSEDNNYIKINDIINSRLQSNKNDIFALLVKLDLTSTTNSCTNIFNTIFLIVEATKENHYSSVTNNIIGLSA